MLACCFHLSHQAKWCFTSESNERLNLPRLVEWETWNMHHFTERSMTIDQSTGIYQTDLEYQAALEVAQLGSALQLKRRERHLVFEWPRPLTREQAAWLNAHVDKLFDSYCIKDELEIQLNTLLEEARDNRKAAAHE